MTDITTTSTQMMWKPKFIRLTSIHEVYKYRDVFLDPSHVHLISQTLVSITDTDPPTKILCTIIYHCNTQHIWVTETPEEVAKLCDEAMGHKWGLKSV